MTDTPYVGRFAPSPTGPLHFGSLVAAVGSYLEARAHGGQWLVRIEDIDPPREVAGASDLILRTLEAYGFEWDGTVLYQSRRDEVYHDTLARLLETGLAYRCRCSRKEAQEATRQAGLAFGIYAGTCRSSAHPPHGAGALRVQVQEAVIEFTDRLQGRQRQDLAREVGDFVVHRADGLWAYQLAVVVDDAAQGVSDIVRGSDLLDSTARQIYLQQLLGLPTPRYLHLPVALNTAGEKLSKQTYAQALDLTHPAPALWHALAFLGQQPPPELEQADLTSVWRWAQQHWRTAAIPPTTSLPAP